MTAPLTLAQQLKAWRRSGVQCRLDGRRVVVSGVRRLSAIERAALFASSEQIRQLLEARAQRRRKNKEPEQQQAMAMPQQQRERRVIGQVVNPGGPLRLLYEDETVPIPPRGRLLGTIPWRK